jgi:hypothetical protein
MPRFKRIIQANNLIPTFDDVAAVKYMSWDSVCAVDLFVEIN